MRLFILHQCDYTSFDANHGWGTIITDVVEILPAKLVGFIKESTIALTSAAVVVADSVMLNKNSSFIFLLSGEGDQNQGLANFRGLLMLVAEKQILFLAIKIQIFQLRNVSSHILIPLINKIDRVKI